MEERKGVGCVEVVVEDTGESVALELLRIVFEADEVIAKGLGLRACLL